MSGRGAGFRPAKVVSVLVTGEDTGASMRVAEKALEANYVIVFPTEKYWCQWDECKSVVAA